MGYRESTGTVFSDPRHLTAADPERERSRRSLVLHRLCRQRRYACVVHLWSEGNFPAAKIHIISARHARWSEARRYGENLIITKGAPLKFITKGAPLKSQGEAIQAHSSGGWPTNRTI
jgi:uncharacterized DUF497 family protein